MKKARILKLCCVLLLLVIGALGMKIPTGAEELPEEFSGVADALPDELRDRLPEEIFSKSPEQAGEAVSQMIRAEYLIETALELLGIELGGALRLLATLTGLLLICAVFGAVRNSFSSDSLSGAFGFCTTAAIFSAIIQLQMKQMQMVEQFFERLSSLMETMIPVMGTLWAMGGNVTTASAGTGTLYVFLAVCQRLCAVSVLPVCSVLTVFALCQTLSPEIGVRGIGSAVKRIYTFVLGLIMTLLMASLSFQTTLTAAADSTAARATKVVTSMAIPIVGGSVGELLRTVSTSVGYLRGAVGLSGILLLLLTLLPTLVELFLARAAWQISASLADLLGCDTEKRLLEEFASLLGYLIAAVSIASSVLLLSFALLTHCAAALG